MVRHELGSDNFSQFSFSNIFENNSNEHFSKNYLIEKAEHILQESINLSLSTDVPLGCLASGGLDSSTIISHIYKNQNINYFTSVPVFDCNETNNVLKIENKLNLKINKIYQTESEDIDTFIKVLDIHDEPFADQSTIAQFKLMKEISNKGIKVILSGNGGDEILWAINNLFLLI